MKSFWEQYRAYIKNNPEGYWFKRKLYGWGWTPATWQGWVTVLVVTILIVTTVIRFDVEHRTEHEIFTILLPRVALLILLLLVISFKTGERPRWQWGLTDLEKELRGEIPDKEKGKKQ